MPCQDREGAARTSLLIVRGTFQQEPSGVWMPASREHKPCASRCPCWGSWAWLCL